MNRRALLTTAFIALTSFGCGGGNSPTTPTPLNVPFSTTDLRVGTGAEATSGKTANVNYTLWLYSTSGPDNKGSQIQSGTLPPFVVGSNQVIAGFSQGVTGMRVGGLRRVVIPPSLGYGSQPSGPIPANSTLIFEIELLSIQ